MAEEMHVVMQEANGVGLAAPQIGVSKRIFVYEIGDTGPRTLINPVIEKVEGEWEHEEGCLSVPGMWFHITRAKRVRVRGYDLDGKEVSYEGEDMEAKLFQHEVDHLDGKLLLERLDAAQRKEAMRELRRRAEAGETGRLDQAGSGQASTGRPSRVAGGPDHASAGSAASGPGAAGTAASGAAARRR